MDQGFIYIATTACLVMLAYFIQRAGSAPECGTYKFSRAFISLMGFGTLLFGGGLAYEVYTRLIVSDDGLRSETWLIGCFFLFTVFTIAYYPSVRFIIKDTTLTYKSIWATKVFDLTQPFTLTCYPASGQYVIRQGKLKTKISSYISGWQYLLEEIEKQATAMEKIEKK
ncbi:hypothetical protein E4656_19900 [Natronospirillum operosum]|uniref:Uncharacterized protein n=1 Tax=Natronospirillum operosum TaxID=2759953 RepID=A0A4Z0W805_9GAMM|nr:hypothetical protein [Natronospirillum operosum]TGG89402.1 hypothetical protein E4656_19900 [Natronospirillum operosum]